MVKCPACGFESPDGASWCDFCKEPFAKKAAPPEIPDAPPSGPSKEVLARAAQDAALARDLLRSDQDKIPAAPDWLRWAAWLLLGAVVIFAMTMLGIFLAKRSAWEDDAAVSRRFEQRP
ncbi:MAG: hypothetical protein PHF00_09405 [Elusimicrobia bacterium]|nr:hypothetical protein [Elusimicrobiota bacterium]